MHSLVIIHKSTHYLGIELVSNAKELGHMVCCELSSNQVF